MSEFNIKVPASKEEMDELRKTLRQEISEEELNAVTGGNEGQQLPPTPWICPFCGTTVMVRTLKDGQKHMAKCPNNPYRGE